MTSGRIVKAKAVKETKRIGRKTIGKTINGKKVGKVETIKSQKIAKTRLEVRSRTEP